MQRVILTAGGKGIAFAEILGIEPCRLSRRAEVVIGTDAHAVARIEVFLTPDELRRITELVTAAPEAAPD